MRPTFETQVPHPKGALVRRIQEELRKPPWNSTSLVFDDYAELHMPPSELRYWSPHLSLSFDGDETHTRILGRFAPRQEVWTLIWIVWIAIVFIIRLRLGPRGSGSSFRICVRRCDDLRLRL